ncbi:argininosuccinate lyase [Lacrimispora sp. 210928-DFI.3.58]|uniref:argininosuccinate lyase n=1 Tax=Lacrimispora sp. 210928-DFI.3.58 TaxID=2883214 RepID=UPI001D088E50|nr:argininosuccinate lyase [Lacrimispora sp. 210928-DFI.3.58]MCB7319136.1 argininosuccinate lyase [Lacrimispora sp. 210928-DFI.3.58]
MRKQTKLVAVLSTAALLAIGASMTSFAATGWAEEDGTWVYYNRDGERATDSWKKSGNNWYYLDSDGEMAIDQLIEDGDNYYYVDINGVMASNQWVAIENEDAGEDDEPDHYWYYFQANGKALTNGDNDKVSLKTINGKKYAFDDEGKMLFGWVEEDNAERVDDSDGEGFKDGMYYFGDSDDGAMTTGWILLDITYDEATDDDYKYTAAAFNDDEDQSRWFYFKSNGKKIYAEDGDRTKDKTINGKKYAFDQYGAMVAEWSLDEDDLKKEAGYAAGVNATGSTAMAVATRSGYSDARVDENGSVSIEGVLKGSGADAKYSQAWKYFNSVEDGSRISKGWFKVVSAEYLNEDKYNDDEDAWYYADGSGNLYACEFKTVKGKKYAFRNDGRMVNGLKFIYEEDGRDNLIVKADDDDYYPFDNEDDFLDHAVEYYEPNGYKCYYFGGSDDGAMRTGKTALTFDGENTNFYFEKSGGNKGAGVTGEKDDKMYQSGMLLKADSDDKYIVVQKVEIKAEEVDGNGNVTQKAEYAYKKLDDAKEFIEAAGLTDAIGSKTGSQDVSVGHVTKDAEDLSEAYTWAALADTATDAEKAARKELRESFILVNTSGKVIDTKSKNKDGNDYYYVVSKGGVIEGVYVED